MLTKMLMKLGVISFLLLTAEEKARAQATYNRWEASPVVPSQPHVTVAQRGPQVMRAKIRQDSLNRLQALRRDSIRIAISATGVPLLQRGIGQRIKESRTIPEDNSYYDYLRKTIRYPAQALRAQVEGKITMRLTINAAGQVSSLSEVENTIPAGATGRDEMVQQAAVLLRQLRFQPGTTTQEELTITYQFL
ncbi:TonB family protein [Hymenobacter psychrotolerans]|uniref:TonB family C-terminal domain-containing protein n=1 Tax=Hymenobacter psychrotolerans DSM 18569 TaxID=1121959 RepID=A0A1M7F8N7_9BACT|nr:TonB family protein [Hymenobacter psychrotolerans]SHM00411.1 TonB family C-terminal domain-containing protein [Hymenobacter psychrotolerans DSM 18569]